MDNVECILEEFATTTFFISENISLVPVENTASIVHEYVSKLHIHHNSIDNVSPIKEINSFKKLSNSKFWTITFSNRVVGILNLVIREQVIDNLLEIHRLYIDEDVRNNNLGGLVLDKVEEISKEFGFDGVAAKVYCENPAINFYERNGFETYYRYMVRQNKN